MQMTMQGQSGQSLRQFPVLHVPSARAPLRVAFGSRRGGLGRRFEMLADQRLWKLGW